MSSSADWLQGVSHVVRDLLHPAFSTSELPSDQEGSRFRTEIRQDGWRAEVTGRVRWRGLELAYEPLGFASFLVQQAQNALQHGSLGVLADDEMIVRFGGRIHVVVNGKAMDGATVSKDEAWRSVRLEMHFAPFEARDASGAIAREPIAARLRAFLGAVTSLSPELGAPPFIEESPSTIVEGARMTVQVNKYERDPRNRSLCIAAHGLRCSVCDMSFEDDYGDIGSGFIHVHHLTPLSIIGKAHVVDAEKDLIPVCPNCHAMLHRKTPPLTPLELRNHLRT